VDVPDYYNKIIILSREKEIELVTAAKAGSKEARDELVMANLSLVVYLARQKKQHKDLEILNYGVQGLLIAIDKFDVSLGYRLSTFARHWITQKIIEGLQLKGGVSRMSHRVRQDVIEKSLMIPVDLEENNFYNLYFVNPSVENDLVKIQMKDDIKASLSTLKSRESDILINHVVEESCTLSDLGNKYGLSRERVRQIEKAALGKLRVKLIGWKVFPSDGG
jgi:RNA polymerase primary sigma factor